MRLRKLLGVLALAAMVLPCSEAVAGNLFADAVGPVKVAPVEKTDPLQVPFIIWGGDVATFNANGGLKTKTDSIYGKMGLKLKLTPGDDFIGQVRAYLKGESPFLRGTMRMIGMASEVISAQESTKPVVFLQLTWSAGDHMVAREGVKTLADLKGKTIALQRGGPHVGMLDDALRAADLKWSDVTVEWCDELTGPKGPAALFRSNPKIAACCVISPDMVGLVGGLESKGTGAEGTIKAARVLVSTAQMSRSIADVYVCRKDFFDANKELVEKFTAGYLKSCEQIVKLKKEFEKGGSKPYINILTMAQGIYGKEVLPTVEIDAHGLVSDCSFVGLPGNKSFFTDEANLSGFKPKMAQALELAVGQGYAKGRAEFINAGFSYEGLAKAGELKAPVVVAPRERFAEMSGDDLFPDATVDLEKKEASTIVSFTVFFKANQNEFPHEEYGESFMRAIKAASTFGNAVIAVGGHGDPTLMLRKVVVGGMKKGTLKRTGAKGSYVYTLEGKPFDLENTAEVIKAIEAGKVTKGTDNPMAVPKALRKLSQERADNVRSAIIEFAKAKGVSVDPSQIQAVGLGPREPEVAKPTDVAGMKKNMRVEFRLVKVSPESINPADFDF
ncbi:MAG: ABC transporter substrate-binding protein [Planctomycetes bacterium]|nr:ABC transporter substrate-binding protein [Planctomycetota bacterium]